MVSAETLGKYASRAVARIRDDLQGHEAAVVVWPKGDPTVPGGRAVAWQVDDETAIALEDAAYYLRTKIGRPFTFQDRVAAWVLECFGAEGMKNILHRCYRFLEEALELVQSLGMTRAEAHQLVDYVFGRDKGDPWQEVGGASTTLAALCTAADIDMAKAGELELARVWLKIDAIRAKEATKPKSGPLPGKAP